MYTGELLCLQDRQNLNIEELELSTPKGIDTLWSYPKSFITEKKIRIIETRNTNSQLRAKRGRLPQQ